MNLQLKKQKYPGKLIVYEGTDGAGKTTLIETTASYLRDKIGYGKVLIVKQPTDISRKTRLFQKMMYCKSHSEIDYRAVQLLTLSDRIQHQYEVIKPALEEGRTVICDRYIYTSAANMESRGYNHEKWFYEVAKNIIKPDLCFLAYIESEQAIKRIKARPEELRRHLDQALLRRVSEYFRDNAEEFGMTVVKTDREVETVFFEIQRKIDAIYGGDQ